MGDAGQARPSVDSAQPPLNVCDNRSFLARPVRAFSLVACSVQRWLARRTRPKAHTFYPLPPAHFAAPRTKGTGRSRAQSVQTFDHPPGQLIPHISQRHATAKAGAAESPKLSAQEESEPKGSGVHHSPSPFTLFPRLLLGLVWAANDPHRNRPGRTHTGGVRSTLYGRPPRATARPPAANDPHQVEGASQGHNTTPHGKAENLHATAAKCTRTRAGGEVPFPVFLPGVALIYREHREQTSKTHVTRFRHWLFLFPVAPGTNANRPGTPGTT